MLLISLVEERLVGWSLTVGEFYSLTGFILSYNRKMNAVFDATEFFKGSVVLKLGQILEQNPRLTKYFFKNVLDLFLKSATILFRKEKL